MRAGVTWTKTRALVLKERSASHFLRTDQHRQIKKILGFACFLVVDGDPLPFVRSAIFPDPSGAGMICIESRRSMSIMNSPVFLLYSSVAPSRYLLALADTMMVLMRPVALRPMAPRQREIRMEG